MSQRFARSFALAARRSAVMLTARSPLIFNRVPLYPSQIRLFASNSTTDFSDAETSLNANALPLKKFYALCDTALDGIQNRLELPDLDIPTFESELTSGALSIKVEGVGNWVLNRQTPNRQIWLASSISGPKRYDWDVAQQQWVYLRDGSKLKELLERELSAATKLKIEFDEAF